MSILTKLTVGTKSTGAKWNRNETPRKINITDIVISDSNELRVYFDESWNVKTDGLIYCDDRFEKELNIYLKKNSIKDKRVEYSEHGMQGDDFVSFDIID